MSKELNEMINVARTTLNALITMLKTNTIEKVFLDKVIYVSDTRICLDRGLGIYLMEFYVQTPNYVYTIKLGEYNKENLNDIRVELKDNIVPQRKVSLSEVIPATETETAKDVLLFSNLLYNNLCQKRLQKGNTKFIEHYNREVDHKHEH